MCLQISLSFDVVWKQYHFRWLSPDILWYQASCGESGERSTTKSDRTSDRAQFSPSPPHVQSSRPLTSIRGAALTTESRRTLLRQITVTTRPTGCGGQKEGWKWTGPGAGRSLASDSGSLLLYVPGFSFLQSGEALEVILWLKKVFDDVKTSLKKFSMMMKA